MIIMAVEKLKGDGSDPFDKLEQGIDNSIYESNQKESLNKPKTPKIKPALSFLTDLDDSKVVYIGRKKSVLKQYGNTSSAFLGMVNEEDCNGAKVHLDGLNPHVVFIDGSRGSGKSYGLGVIAEELAKKNPYIGQIVIDPVGVFWSMRFPNQERKELEQLEKWGLSPEGLNNIKVFVPEGMANKISKETYDETFSMYPSLLSTDDWCLTFGIDRFNPTGLLLEKTLSHVKHGFVAKLEEDKEEKIHPKGNQFTLDDIIYCLQYCKEFKSSSTGYKPDSIRALVSRFDAAKSWGIFSDHGTPLSKLSRENQLTILDTSFLDDNISALVIGILARRILSARKLVTRQDAIKKFDDNTENPDELLELEIPPTWLYIDEAHTLIPSGNTITPATNAIIEYVKQGRRPGCSMVFATQQPSAINSKVLSQVDIFISHKLVFNDDISAVQKRMPAIIPGEYKNPNFIKTLPVGVALIGDRGEETSRAFIIKIKPRLSQHEGRDAETIRTVVKKDFDEVLSIVLDLIEKKLLKVKQLKVSDAKDILDIINIKYKSNVNYKQLRIPLLEKNIIEREEYLFFNTEKITKQKAEIPKEEQDAITDVLNEYESNEDLSEERENLDSAVLIDKVKTLPVRITKEIAENKSQRGILKFLNKKKIKSSFLEYRKIYKINYNYFDENEHFAELVAYLDSVTGEFLHFDKNCYFKHSTGLPLVKDLGENELLILQTLKEPKTLQEIAKELEAPQDLLKKDLISLVDSGICDVKVINQEEYFLIITKKIDIPYDPLLKIISSLSELPLKSEENILEEAIESENYTKEDFETMLSKLWKTIEITEVSNIFWPIWNIVFENTQKDSFPALKIDAVLGQKI